MILDRAPVVEPVRAKAWGAALQRSSPALLREVGVFACFLLAIIVLQMASGAYRAEFGGYPDEPAHYVTSLMVREYVTHLPWVSPMHFAQNYYRHYPKVAFGHWPPLFYVVQAAWMSLFSASRISVILELAFTTAVLAYTTFREASRWFNWRAGALAGLLTICLPLVQTYTDEEMAETLLALMCLWSVIFFERYLESERWQDNLWYGVFFSLAVLTKGSGWLLAFIPPIAMILTRKIGLLFKGSFWIAPVLVALSCIPWQLMTLQLAQQGWDGGSTPTLRYTLIALREFCGVTIGILGGVLSALAAIGILVSVAVPAFRGAVKPVPAVMFALVVADWVFHSVIPAGIEDRKMIIAVPALILFVFAGAIAIADHLPLRGALWRWRRELIGTVAALGFAFQTFSIPREHHYGYTEVAKYIVSSLGPGNSTILVSSDFKGEGLLVSELALEEPEPRNTILRATKALAQVTWNVSSYRARFNTTESLVRFLQDQHVNFVVVDTFNPLNDLQHDRLVKEAIKKSGRFQLVRSFPSQASDEHGEIQIYRFANDDSKT